MATTHKTGGSVLVTAVKQQGRTKEWSLQTQRREEVGVTLVTLQGGNNFCSSNPPEKKIAVMVRFGEEEKDVGRSRLGSTSVKVGQGGSRLG